MPRFFTLSRLRWPLLALAASYLLAVHGLGYLALAKTDLWQRILAQSGLDDRPEFDDDFGRQMERLIDLDRAAPKQAVVLLGDSHIRRLDLADTPYPTVNLSASGETSSRLLARLAHYRSLEEARAVVLGIGLNDIFYRDAEAFATNVNQVLRLLPRGKPLVVQAIMPVNEGSQEVGLDNDQIDAFNVVLGEACAARARCIFVDLTPVMEDEAGELTAERHVGDGLHLTKEAEALLREWMAAGVDKALEQPPAPASPISANPPVAPLPDFALTPPATEDAPAAPEERAKDDWPEENLDDSRWRTWPRPDRWDGSLAAVGEPSRFR